MPEYTDPVLLLTDRFGDGPKPSVVSVPGRVNLIGEHVDYHNLAVLPIAIQRRLRIAFRPRRDRRIRAASRGFGEREFEWTPRLQPGPSGDWENYLKAAAQAVEGRWPLDYGIDAAIVSDLPPAAGLSSSSALLTGITLALLEANGVRASFEELMGILPDGEHFVGTRGGGMDHAAVLASRAGCALLIGFAPVSASAIPIPRDWGFLIAHSLTSAEKSGAVRAEYNSRREAGTRALSRLGFSSYAEAIHNRTYGELEAAAASLADDERRCFLHVAGEALRVDSAVARLRDGNARAFGEALNASHDSLRDLLRVSCPSLDAIVQTARDAGALGARLTGAGFGGFAVIFSEASDRDRIAAALQERYYRGRGGFDPETHLIAVEPSEGALFA